MAKFIFLLFLITASFNGYTQFKLLNDAAYMPNGCIQLTPDIPYAEGIAYSTTKLNLNKHFEIELDIFLGDKEEGADGITFVIHNDARGYNAFGTWGECMGYGTWSRAFAGGTYIAPSIAIEFDTYHNRRQNDPISDHVSYLENGSSFHNQFWNDSDSTFNLEDDLLHTFKFRWNPEKKRISVYLDGSLVFQGTRDLVNDVFKGNPEVIWGFTASTGRASNLQYFCLRKLAMNQSSPHLNHNQTSQLISTD